MNLKLLAHPLYVLLLVAALLVANLACNTQQEVTRVVEVTSTPDPQAAIEGSVSGTIQATQPTAEPTPPPTATPTRKPTATPVPSPTPLPTATPQPTPAATPVPSPTPLPTATPQPTPTATPESSSVQSERFLVDAGNIVYNIIQAPEDGYINYEIDSVKDGNPSEPLDINFVISDQSWILFQANNITWFVASIQVDKGEEYQFLFDNTSSLFAGKAVSFRYSWSSQPIYPVMPYFGEHEDTDTCKQLEALPSSEGIPIETLLQMGFAAYTGDWFSLAMSVLELYISINQSDLVGATNSDKAGYATLLWACGIEP